MYSLLLYVEWSLLQWSLAIPTLAWCANPLPQWRRVVGSLRIEVGIPPVASKAVSRAGVSVGNATHK